jgi:hypothetical protein
MSRKAGEVGGDNRGPFVRKYLHVWRPKAAAGARRS